MKKTLIALASVAAISAGSVVPASAQTFPQIGTRSSSSMAFFDLPDDVRNWIVTLVALPAAGSSFLFNVLSSTP